MPTDIFEVTFEKAPIGIAHIGSDGKWIRVNQYLCDFLGYSKDELLAITFQDITYLGDLDYDLSRVKKIHDDESDSFNLEKRYIHKDGTLKWAQLSVSAIRNEQRTVDYFISTIIDINERKELEEVLNQSNDSHKEINNCLQKAEHLAKLGNWSLNIQSSRLYWSDEIFRIFEIDQNSFQANYEGFLNAIHPEDRDMVNNAYTQSLETRENYQIIHRLLMSDGRIKYVIEQCETTFDEHNNPMVSNGTIQDITELHKTQLKLIESEQFYRTIVAAIDRAIIILENNIIIDCNPVALMMFEVSEENLLGTNIINPNYTLSCSDADFVDYIPKVNDNNTIQTQATLLLNNNIKSSKILEITLAQYGNDTQKIIMLASDITQKLEEENFFKTHTRQAQMGEMISMIAHQWRQPLAIINAITSQLRLQEMLKYDEDTNLIEQLIKIEQQSIHLSQTISDYRDFFRPDKQFENVFLSELIDHALELIDHTIKSKGISIRTVIVSPSNVQVYRNEIIQVLISLLKNTFDAFDDNKITNRQIDIEVNQEGKYGTITLKDNAGGIPEDIIPKLFIPYFTTKSDTSGTGLGLYMSKMIVEEHCNGTLEISSVNQETCIVMKLLNWQTQ